MQNISIAGEIGDWDSFSYIDEKGKVNYRGRVDSREALSQYRARVVLSSITASYLSQALISSILTNDNFISVENWWNIIKEGFSI